MIRGTRCARARTTVSCASTMRRGKSISGRATGRTETMGYYDQADCPSIRAGADGRDQRSLLLFVLGPTLPNRAYSNGSDLVRPSHDRRDRPASRSASALPPHHGNDPDLLDWPRRDVDGLPLEPALDGDFPRSRSNAPGPGQLPSGVRPSEARRLCVAGGVLIDSFFGLSPADLPLENDEHPPSTSRRASLRLPDREHSQEQRLLGRLGDLHHLRRARRFYDHVPPPRAPQDGARNPDGIDPGSALTNRPRRRASSPASGRIAQSARSTRSPLPGVRFRWPSTRHTPPHARISISSGSRPVHGVSPFSKPGYVFSRGRRPFFHARLHREALPEQRFGRRRRGRRGRR